MIRSEKLHSFISKFKQFIAISLAKVMLSACLSFSGKAFPNINAPFLDA